MRKRKSSKIGWTYADSILAHDLILVMPAELKLKMETVKIKPSFSILRIPENTRWQGIVVMFYWLGKVSTLKVHSMEEEFQKKPSNAMRSLRINEDDDLDQYIMDSDSQSILG
jgi:hypothetical protein